MELYVFNFNRRNINLFKYIDVIHINYLSDIKCYHIFIITLLLQKNIFNGIEYARTTKVM